MSVFTKHLKTQLKRCGTLWNTDIDNECVSFYAVFDSEQTVQTDTTGLTALITGCVLTMETDIAVNLAYNQILNDENEKQWYAREVTMIGDGSESKITLVEVPT